MHPYKRSKLPAAPYYVQFCHNGRRYQLCTKETDYEKAKCAGMRLKADTAAGISKRAPVGDTTIRSITDTYLNYAVNVKVATKHKNVSCLKRILDASGFCLDSSMEVLTRKLVIKYQSAGMDMLRAERERHSATISRNSTVRQARSIFSKRCMALYDEFSLPDFSGFMKHPLLREPRKEYVPPPSDTLAKITGSAASLKLTCPAAYAALLLQLYCGLRPSELVEARWAWVREDNSGHFLEIPFSVAKTDSSRTVGMDPSVHAELLSLKETEYLIPGRSDNARWKAVHRKLGPWLRAHGLTGTKTNYELRKLFGSKLATEQGLFAAQRALGHAKPSTTSDYYAAMLNRPTPIRVGAFSVPAPACT